MDDQKIIFCSDLCTLQALHKMGLGLSSAILSDSPNIHHMLAATSINDRTPPENLTALAREIDLLCVSIYESLKSAGFEYDSYAVMYQLICLQNFFSKALCIRNEDFEKEVLIIEVEDSSLKNLRFENYFSIIFRDHFHCQKIKVKLSDIDVSDPLNYIYNKKENVLLNFIKALFSNISIYPLETAFWPILKRFWPFLSFLKIPGVVILEDSQIIRSVCTKLSFQGYSFERMKNRLAFNYKKNSSLHIQESADRFKKISQIIESKIRDFINEKIVFKARSAVFDHVWKAVESCHNKYYLSYKTSIPFIDSHMKNKKAVLSNMLKDPYEYGFAVACREKNVKVITFQHGICREISPHFDYISQITESNLAHFFLCNTKKAAKISTGLPYSKAQAIPVGITKDYYTGSKFVPSKKFPEIFFVSTNVYSGNISQIRGGGDDKLRYKNEQFIIKDILAKANKSILYKAYPNQRYLDTDPCHEEVLKHKNLVLYYEIKDFRYVSKHARVLITGSATSTINWCFLTEKPVIFFDHPYIAPLRKELVPLFKEMLFYFDLTENNVEQKVLEILNLPTNEIESLYHCREKQTSRKKFIDEIYFEQRNGAEERATQFVKGLLQKKSA